MVINPIAAVTRTFPITDWVFKPIGPYVVHAHDADTINTIYPAPGFEIKPQFLSDPRIQEPILTNPSITPNGKWMLIKECYREAITNPFDSRYSQVQSSLEAHDGKTFIWRNHIAIVPLSRNLKPNFKKRHTIQLSDEIYQHYPLGLADPRPVVTKDGVGILCTLVKTYDIDKSVPPGRAIQGQYIGLLKAKDFGSKTWEFVGLIGPDRFDKNANFIQMGKGDSEGVLFHTQYPNIVYTKVDDLTRLGQNEQRKRFWAEQDAAPFGNSTSKPFLTPAFVWEKHHVAMTQPPIRIPKEIRTKLHLTAGWLAIYHGLQYVETPDGQKQRRYGVGALLLNNEQPWVIEARSPVSLFEGPRIPPGGVNYPDGFCIFPSGGLIRDDYFHLFYGISDYYTGHARTLVANLIKFLQQFPTTPEGELTHVANDNARRLQAHAQGGRSGQGAQPVKTPHPLTTEKNKDKGYTPYKQPLLEAVRCALLVYDGEQFMDAMEHLTKALTNNSSVGSDTTESKDNLSALFWYLGSHYMIPQNQVFGSFYYPIDLDGSELVVQLTKLQDPGDYSLSIDIVDKTPNQSIMPKWQALHLDEGEKTFHFIHPDKLPAIALA